MDTNIAWQNRQTCSRFCASVSILKSDVVFSVLKCERKIRKNSSIFNSRSNHTLSGFYLPKTRCGNLQKALQYRRNSPISQLLP